VSSRAHLAIRLAALIAFAGGLGLAYHRLHRTPEQEALQKLVEDDLPKLRGPEGEIEARVSRLNRAPGLKPDEARALLVDDVLPRLVRLKKQAEELPAPTPETRALRDEYLKVTDQLVDACRTCVRIIDDPKLSEGVGVAQVRERFLAVSQAYRAWDQHVAEACARHRLAAPSAAH
jgi:hypothetical protein